MEIGHVEAVPFDILRSYLRLRVPIADRTVLELSGGLESSSVLLAMRSVAGADQPLFCLHYYHDEVGSSNEIEHARRVAEYTRAHLNTVAVSALPFAPVASLPRVAKPYVRYNALASIQEYAGQLAGGYGSTMISGHGGDALFLEPPPMSALVDAALATRRRSLARVALDLALIHRAPLAKVVSGALRQVFAAEPSGGLLGGFELFADDLREERPNVSGLVISVILDRGRSGVWLEA